MAHNAHSRYKVQVTAIVLAASCLIPGSAGWTQAAQVQAPVGHTPVASQPLPGDSGRSLTAVQVELPPGATVPGHHHAGIVFAYVLEGSVRSRLNEGDTVEYRTGEYWVEPPGTQHTLTENASRSMPARLLAVFVAPTGARLTTYDK